MKRWKMLTVFTIVYIMVVAMLLKLYPLKEEVLFQIPGVVKLVRQHTSIMRELTTFIGLCLAGGAAILYIEIAYQLDCSSPEKYKWWKIWR